MHDIIHRVEAGRPAPVSLFRSQRHERLLALTLLRPEREYTLAELGRLLDAPQATIHRDVKDLAGTGVLRTRRVGRNRLVSADTQSSLARPLAAVVARTQGPIAAVRQELGSIERVDLVLIFGSWAARYRGRPGRPPADLDVLVVGTPSRREVYDAAERTEARIGMPVHPVVLSRDRWEAGSGLLVSEARRSDPVVVLDRLGGPR